MIASDLLEELAPRWASVEPQVLARTWHAVARAADVAADPVRVDLLGTQLVLARLDGEVAAFDDVCAHRGAALSLGRVEGSCLACPYHGWEYAATGECTRIPALPEGRHVPGAARLTPRRCAERGGLVWVCLGEPLAAVPAFPEPGPGWRVIVGEPYEWCCDPTRRLENFLDFAHFAFVHDGVLGHRDDPFVPRHDVVVDGQEMFVHQERREPTSAVKPGGDAPDAFTTIVDYVVHLPLAAVLDQRLPGGQRFVLGIASTPVGDGRSRTFWVLARDYDLAGDDAPYIAFQKGVNEQDRPVIESLRPEFVPLDVTAELHVRDVDQVAIAYRRALLGLNARTRGDHTCSSAR
ncbi:MAG: aromatic ring-hydroxylating dioxygenase subunit alpha [Ilumatobacteraceae bacterium]